MALWPAAPTLWGCTPEAVPSTSFYKEVAVGRNHRPHSLARQEGQWTACWLPSLNPPPPSHYSAFEHLCVSLLVTPRLL